MALQSGLHFTNLDDIPEQSRPDAPLADLASLPTGQGVRHRARMAADGSRWCLGCYTTFSFTSQKALCGGCGQERDRIRHSERRRSAASTSVQIPRAALDKLVRHTQQVEMRIGQVLSAVATGHSADAPGQHLARVSKEISALVRNEFIPRMHDQRGPHD